MTARIAGIRRVRPCLAWTAIALGTSLVGCSVGDGTGIARGSLTVNQCKFDPDRPLISTTYDLQPDFFVGEPLDSNPITAPGFQANQMIIRVQRSGARIEFSDALLFWILDSAEVARCLRGRMNADGTPDWDPTLCDRSPTSVGPDGEGRMFVGMTSEAVFSSFVLNASCPKAYVSADALGVCTDGSCPLTFCPGHDSWISFSHFGNTPTDPTKAVPANYRVNDGERIKASAFHVELCDVATVLSKLQNVMPVPPPAIVGTLDGSFDFDLERGQAGQAFP